MGSGNAFLSLMAIKLVVWILLLISCNGSTNQTIRMPGCLLQDYDYPLDKGGCVTKSVPMKMCSGHCESHTSPNNEMETIASCCTIAEHELMTVNLTCIEGVENIIQMRLPTACECFVCEN